MAPEPADEPAGESSLNKLIAAYIQAVDAGQAPDRGQWLARHPELASELETFFANLDHLDRLAASPVPARLAAEAPTEALDRSPPSGAATPPLGAVGSIGDYELLAEIGRGGMGVVYKACQGSLNRIVALKMILAGQLASPADVQRFQIEAEATANLDHPQIVPIYEIGEHQGQRYFSMKLVDGSSLDRLVPHLVEDPRAAARLLALVARAVHYAHQRGILHRDLKPANILVDSRGQPHVTDFGLAKRVEGDTGLTQSGVILGTPSYMAPEQAWRRKAAVTTAADVYSLGAVLYELLTGRPPFRASTLLETLIEVLEREPERPRALNPRVGRDLETICRKCLQKDPRRRYESAEALAEDLERWLSGEPIQARPVSHLERLWRWCRRNPALATLGGLAAAAVVAVVAISVGFAIHQSRAAAALLREQQKTRAALHESETQHRQTKRLSAGLALDRGQALCEGGDVGRGMLWLARSLEIAPDDALGLRQVIRANLAGWYHRLTPLKASLPHRGPVRAVAFSPDGRMVLTGSYDKTGQLWDATGKPLGPPLRHEDWVMALAFSPDGKTIVTGSLDKTAGLWQAATGQLLRKLPHDREVVAVAWSPDGRTVLTGSADQTARLWDAASGKLRRELRHGGPIVEVDDVRQRSGELPYGGEFMAVAWSPDGRTVLTGSTDHTARLWSAGTGQLLHKLRHAAKVVAVAFSPDGRTVLTGSADQTARLWAAATGKPIGPPLRHQGTVDAVAWSPNAKVLLTGSDMSARLWEPVSGRLLSQLDHQGEVGAVAFSPDGRTVVTGSYDQTARLWDALTGKPLDSPLQHQAEVYAVAVSPGGKTILTGSGTTIPFVGAMGEARLWEMATRNPWSRLFQHPESVAAVGFRPDGKIIVTGCWDGIARLWDARTGKELRRLRGHRGAVWTVAFSPDGRTVLTGSTDHTARLWAAATGKELRRFQDHQGAIHAVAFSPDGKTILTASWDGTARLWDTGTGQELRCLRGRVAAVWAVAFSPDGRTILTGSWDRTARRWAAATGKPIGPPLVHQDTVTAVAFSPDGRTILTGSKDKTARLWEAASGKPIGPPLEHHNMVKAVAFSPDGRTVLTGTLDGTAQLWDVATAQRIGPAFSHQSDVVAVAFDPDGRTILTGSYDTTARLWEVPLALQGEAARISLWAQVITGMELDFGSGVHRLDAQVWRRRHQRLHERGGLPLP